MVIHPFSIKSVLALNNLLLDVIEAMQLWSSAISQDLSPTHSTWRHYMNDRFSRGTLKQYEININQCIYTASLSNPLTNTCARPPFAGMTCWRPVPLWTDGRLHPGSTQLSNTPYITGSRTKPFHCTPSRVPSLWDPSCNLEQSTLSNVMQ